MDYTNNRTYVNISINTIKNNLIKIKTIRDLPLIMSVLKSDGYGHGIKTSVQALNDETDWYGVATFEEAKKIREAGSSKPILVLGMISLRNIKEAVESNITCTLVSKDYAVALSDYCLSNDLIMNCHLKIDTGFNRIGLKTDNKSLLHEQLEIIYGLNGIKIEGVYTHFSCAGSKKDDDVEFTRQQYSSYIDTCKYIESKHEKIKIKHCCNSRATLYNSEYYLDMVRIGMFLYGLGPDEDRQITKVVPAMEWRANIVDVKKVKKGESVSYSRTFVADQDVVIAIISCGFGDGYYRALYTCEKPIVLINDVRCHVLGKICMDYMIVKLEKKLDPSLVNEAVLIGSTESDEVTANELSRYVGSTGVEVTSQVTKRVKRIVVS